MLNLGKCIFSISIIFCFDILVLSEIPRPLGVSLDYANLYEPGETFLCLDGLKTIKYTQINDDYCDCADFSDEPGTSACPEGTFHCTNAGHKAKDIRSSMVNDGICDCCDGSDEYNSNARCVNNCKELQKAEKEIEQMKQELVKKGSQIKAELSEKGKQVKIQREAKLAELKLEKANAESIRKEKEKVKISAESLENDALQVYRDAQENEQQEKVEKEALENSKEAEKTFERFDSNQDGYIEIIEIQTRIEFDKDRNGEVSEEEAKYFLNENDRIELESFITLAWPRIKPYLMLNSGLFEPPKTEDQSEKEEKEDDLATEEYEQQNEPTREQQIEENEDAEIVDDDTNFESDEHENSQTVPDYDPQTQKLVELANEARNQFSEADRIVREVDGEIKEIEELMSKNYGDEEEYAPLDGECFTFEDREYIYKLCPFDRASQQSKSGSAETRLGSWDRWNGKENIYSHMLYSNGASCWNGPQRSALVSLLCGLENKITSVAEPNRCEYHLTFQTPAACETREQDNKKSHDEL